MISLFIKTNVSTALDLIVAYFRLHEGQGKGPPVLGARITSHSLVRYHRGGYDPNPSYEC
jgi:hypothetical protein